VGTVGSKSSVNGQIRVLCILVVTVLMCLTPVNSCNNENAGSGLYANNTDLSELTLPTFTECASTPSFYPGPRPILLPEKNARGTKVSFGIPSSKITVRQTMSVECF